MRSTPQFQMGSHLRHRGRRHRNAALAAVLLDVPAEGRRVEAGEARRAGQHQHVQHRQRLRVQACRGQGGCMRLQDEGEGHGRVMVRPRVMGDAFAISSRDVIVLRSAAARRICACNSHTCEG